MAPVAAIVVGIEAIHEAHECPIPWKAMVFQRRESNIFGSEFRLQAKHLVIVTLLVQVQASLGQLELPIDRFL